MSDDDMDMMYEDDEDMMEEDEPGEGEGELEGEALLENMFYNNKALIDEDLPAALKGFEKIVEMEKEKGVWGFKSLKKMTKLYLQQKNNQKVEEKFSQFMEYGKSAVTNNAIEKGLNSVLDSVGQNNDLTLTSKLYSIAMNWLQKSGNERVWFRTTLKFGKLLYDLGEHAKLEKILRDLHKSCQNEKGEDDQKKGSQLVDIYALEIQMYTATKNTKKLKELYHKALGIRSAIPHPRIMGIVRECGGKMHMREKQWEAAHTDFFEAFKNYDEAGSPRRIQCLKYLVLANMLMLSEINPFEAPETKPYKNDSEIVAMTSLVSAYERNDIKTFEKILKDNKKTILDDSFIRDYIDDLLKNIRTQVLLKLLQPYTKIRLQFIAEELGISSKEVQDLLVSLILDAKIRGRIDQIREILELEPTKSSNHWKYQSVDKWATQLSALQTTLYNRLS